MTAPDRTQTTLDGVGLAVIANRFDAIVRTMQTTLVRTSRSGVLNTAKDCSCCVLTAEDDVLAVAESLPIHVMAGPELQSAYMRSLYPTLAPGDAFLDNSPYVGNSHAADFCILVPIVSPDGVHRFTAYVKGHQADCGNGKPTTYTMAARDVYEEGALIFPCVRIQEDYRDREDVIRMCRNRIRVPDQWWGDYLAMLGAARIGQRRMLELGEELGWERLEAYAAQWLSYSEERMVSALQTLPSGTVVEQTKHDPIPQLPQGIDLRVSVTVDSDRGNVEIDLRDNPDCLPCGLNLTEATARSGAILGLMNSIDHTVPKNAGSVRRVKVHLRENCCVGIPRHPASCSVATTNLLDRVANAVQRAVSTLGDGLGHAEFGPGLPATVPVISGRDPRRDNDPYINQIFFAWTSGAGGPVADGWLTHCGVGDGGVIQHESVELNELRFPILVRSERIVPDTEGAGRHRGAPSGVVEFGPVGADMEVMYASDGSVEPARGARDGQAGGRARQQRRAVDGRVTDEEPFGHLLLRDGEILIATSAGGGGYGHPSERDPERVAHDVREGWITSARARNVYRVVLTEDGHVDVAATTAARRELNSAGQEPTTPPADGFVPYAAGSSGTDEQRVP